MRTPHALIALVLATSLAIPPAAAQAPTDTVAVVANTSSPVLAVDPVTHSPHIVQVTDGVLVHEWKSAGIWHTEPVATGVEYRPFGGADLRLTSTGTLFALYISAGSVVFAERVAGVWQSEPLDAGAVRVVALAVSPVSGEPVAVWANRPLGVGTPADIKLARRSGGVWTTQLLDTTTVAGSRLSVAVAVDAANRPVVAWTRPRGDDVTGVVLTCATASGPGGPFTAAPVDSLLNGSISLALDPANGRPRIAYAAALPSTIGGSVRYAARTGDGSWELMTVSPFNTVSSAPSLALDPNGDPYIAHTIYTPVAPQAVREGLPDPAACLYTSTGEIVLEHRAGGEGAGAFASVATLGIDQDNSANGPRAVDAVAPADPAVAWGSPLPYGDASNPCGPFAVSYRLGSPVAGVGPGPGVRVGIGAVSPNPARRGETVHASFALAEAADVTLELHDVAGRLLAARGFGRLPAGPGALDWAPAPPRPGVFWLLVRADGRPLGARALVVIR